MDIRGKKGAWINQFAMPTPDQLMVRAPAVDYLIIKYGMRQYELAANVKGWPWLAERMAEGGAGDQTAPARAEMYGQQLAEQANQPGCVGAVINLEESDGGWHTDDGTATLKLIRKYRSLCNKPLYASLDTRGNRPNYPYQRVCAEQCDGVMPMVYPKAFGQTAAQAFAASLNALFRSMWNSKPIIPTIQSYDAITPQGVVDQMITAGRYSVSGVSVYTLGHATNSEWMAFVNTMILFPSIPTPPPVTTLPNDAVRALLFEARVKHLEAMMQLAMRGTPTEILAYATFWKNASE